MQLVALAVMTLFVLGSGAAVEQIGPESATALAANATPAAGSARFLVSFGSEHYEAGVINLGDETAVLDKGGIFGSGSRYWPITRREAAVLGITEKLWYESKAGGYALVGDPFLIGTRSLFEVIGHAERVQAIGRGTERGIPVHRYSAKVPLEAFLAELPPFEKEATKPGDGGPTSWRDYLVNYLGADEGGQSLELAVDSQGRIRRARLELSGPVTVELYDYGVPVDVTPPLGNEVISSTAYEKLKSDYCSDPRRQTLPRPYPC